MAISIPSDCSQFRVAVTPMFVFVLVLRLFGLLCVILNLDGFTRATTAKGYWVDHASVAEG